MGYLTVQVKLYFINVCSGMWVEAGFLESASLSNSGTLHDIT